MHAFGVLLLTVCQPVAPLAFHELKLQSTDLNKLLKSGFKSKFGFASI